MSDSIMCVRIAQRVLPSMGESRYTIFPFDRVYLGKKHLAPQFKKLFRYYLQLDLDDALLDALNQLWVATTHTTPIQRDNDLQQKRPPKTCRNAFIGAIENPTEWLLVVPSHVRTIYKKPEEYKEAQKSELSYILSRAVTAQHNSKTRLPPVTLVTPTRTIPILCAVCRYSLDLHQGNCLPGQASCKRKTRVVLRLDSHNGNTEEQSANEAGDY